jgi:hypothetical protein
MNCLKHTQQSSRWWFQFSIHQGRLLHTSTSLKQHLSCFWTKEFYSVEANDNKMVIEVDFMEGLRGSVCFHNFILYWTGY